MGIFGTFPERNEAKKSVWFWFDFYINWYSIALTSCPKILKKYEVVIFWHFCQFWWFHIKIILSVKHILSRPFPNENFSKIRNFWHVISYKKCHVIDNYRTSGFNGKTSGLLAYYYVRIFMSYTFSITIHLGIACFG